MKHRRSDHWINQTREVAHAREEQKRLLRTLRFVLLCALGVSALWHIAEQQETVDPRRALLKKPAPTTPEFNRKEAATATKKKSAPAVSVPAAAPLERVVGK